MIFNLIVGIFNNRTFLSFMEISMNSIPLRRVDEILSIRFIVLQM